MVRRDFTSAALGSSPCHCPACLGRPNLWRPTKPHYQGMRRKLEQAERRQERCLWRSLVIIEINLFYHLHLTHIGHFAVFWNASGLSMATNVLPFCNAITS